MLVSDSNFLVFAMWRRNQAIITAKKKLALHLPMAATTKVAPIYALLPFLLLFDVGIAVEPLCPPFPCGQLQNIGFPFRRKDDPAGCGETDYQLTCDGDEAIMHIGSAEYYVTEVYSDGFRLVDASLANGSCRLPAQSLLSINTEFYIGYNNLWASFVSCTEAIDDMIYQLVPCLSENNTFVYVIVGYVSYELQYLKPSCNPLAFVPVPTAYFRDLTSDYFVKNTSAIDVFSILQKGFDCELPGVSSRKRKRNIDWCLKVASSTFSEKGRKQLLHSAPHDALAYDHISSNQLIYSIYSLAYSELTFFYCLFPHNHPFARALTVFIQILQVSIVLVILGRILFTPLTVCFFLAYKLRSSRVSVDAIEKFLRNQQSLMPKRYAYTDIIAITRHFGDKLGQGGFGSVFKGELPGGILVAVKLLGNSKCNGDEFISEVSTIGRIHHVNVVRLVGFCSEGSKRALVYEYMPNGSLDKYIFSPDGHAFASEKLTDIAIGVARGIDYLHRGCDMQILHFDIKPHNILLDHNFLPKVSDFGLAKLYPKDNNLVSISAARGTVGYIAPELISRSFGIVSYKSDVYSYGMLLMEMAGRRRNVNPLAQSSSQVYYPSWVYDKLTQQNDIQPNSAFEIRDSEKKLSMIGLWCIQMKSSDRPTMTKVLEMLEADVDTLPMPPKPFLSSADAISERGSCLNSSSAELSIISE